MSARTRPSLQKGALYLASRGIGLPVYPPKDGRCTCNVPDCDKEANAGKHPRVKWKEGRPPASRRSGGGGTSGRTRTSAPPAPARAIRPRDRSRHDGDDSYLSWSSATASCPGAPQVKSGGGGEHYYLAHPGYKVRNSAGKSRTWARHSGRQRLRGLPAVSARLRAPLRVGRTARRDRAPARPRNGCSGSRRAGPQRRRPVRMPVKIPHGRQWHHLVSLAGTMRKRGMTEPALAAALIAENDEHCERPGRTRTCARSRARR